MKLLFLADKLHFNKYGRTISGDSYFAMEMGPVLSTTWSLVCPENPSYKVETKWRIYMHKYMLFDSHEILRSTKPVDYDEFSDSDIECLEETIRTYITHSTDEIIEILHTFPEWSNAWFNRPHDGTGRVKMPVESLIEESSGEIIWNTARLISEAQAAF